MDQAPPVLRQEPPVPGSMRITTTQLFQGRRYIVIVHSGQEYRLQITKTGKLILTK